MNRFIRDESGITMALVVIMIVLIGVMGAGLLVFVNRDLESVVEVNQGQRALEMSDAGMDSAKRQLNNVDAKPSSYDSIVTAGNSDWYDNGSSGSGKALTFDGNQIRVGIRYLLPSATASDTRKPDYAPRVLPNYGADACNDTNGDGVDDDVGAGDQDACAYPNSAKYFRVTVRGSTGKAVRQIQGIYKTQNVDFPVAYYATRDIDFGGNATDTINVSFFANRYITDLREGTIQGQDLAYGNWATNPDGSSNAYNRIPRGTADAGAAALGNTPGDSGLKYSPTSAENSQKNNTAGAGQLYGRRDYDRDSGLAPVSSKAFRANTWGTPGAPTLSSQPNNVITYPFETGNTSADDTVIAQLKQKARDNGTYVRRPPGDTTFDILDGTGVGQFPKNSSLTDTVFFVEFASGTDDAPIYGAKGKATYKAGTENADGLGKGTVVVMNGDLDTNSSGANFEGAMIVRDPDDTDNNIEANVMKYDNGGSININGFINVEGDIKLRGSVNGFLPGALVNGLPGLIDVSLWSWRECYNTTCGA